MRCSAARSYFQSPLVNNLQVTDQLAWADSVVPNHSFKQSSDALLLDQGTVALTRAQLSMPWTSKKLDRAPVMIAFLHRSSAKRAHTDHRLCMASNGMSSNTLAFPVVPAEITRSADGSFRSPCRSESVSIPPSHLRLTEYQNEGRYRAEFLPLQFDLVFVASRHVSSVVVEYISFQHLSDPGYADNPASCGAAHGAYVPSRLANANISSLVLKDLMGHQSFDDNSAVYQAHRYNPGEPHPRRR
jgi:hypothetical protein